MFVISETEKKEIYNEFPEVKTVYRKPFYALLSKMEKWNDQC